MIASDDADAIERGIVDTLKNQKIARDAQLAKDQKDLADREEIDRYVSDVLEVQSALARTGAERAAVELRILALQKAEEDRRLKAEHDANLSRIGDAPEQVDARDSENSRYRAATAAAGDSYRARVQQSQHANLDPLQKFADETPKNAKEAGEAIETYAVKAMDDFNSSAAQAIASGQSIGDVLKRASKTPKPR